jgi:ABC-type amino acid transport substrate-binding protein
MTFSTTQSGKLTIAAGNYDCPMLNYVKDGTRQGYEVETAEAVCRLLNLEPIWISVPPVDFYTRLNANHYDAVWFIQTITPARQAIVSFSRPYCTINDAVMVMKNSPVQTETDLAGLRVGALANTTLFTLATEKFLNSEIIAFPGTDNALPGMLDALKAGKVDALIDDEPILKEIANDIPDFRVAFTIPTQAPFGVAVNQKNPLLLKAIDDALESLLANGTLAEFWSQHIPLIPFPL